MLRTTLDGKCVFVYAPQTKDNRTWLIDIVKQNVYLCGEPKGNEKVTEREPQVRKRCSKRRYRAIKRTAAAWYKKGRRPSGLAGAPFSARRFVSPCVVNSLCCFVYRHELVRGGEAAALVIDKLMPNCHLSFLLNQFSYLFV